MMGVNIDLVFGNGYHKGEAKKGAKAERQCCEGEMARKCMESAGEPLTHSAGNPAQAKPGSARWRKH